jgi:hypothetical protein
MLKFLFSFFNIKKPRLFLQDVPYLETLVEPDYVIKELDRIATKHLKSNSN